MITLLRSWYWRLVLRLRGAKVGRNLRVTGPMTLYFRDGATAHNIEIGDDVTIDGPAHLKLRKRGRIVLGNEVGVGPYTWLVTANEAEVRIGDHSRLGGMIVMNGGHGIRLGRYCLLAGFIYFASSDHRIDDRAKPIMQQGHIGAPIIIGDNVWIGGQVFICKGVTIGSGAVIGAGSTVTRDVPAEFIAAGNPARLIRHRFPDEPAADHPQEPATP